MKRTIEIICIAILFCLPLGSSAQDIVTRSKPTGKTLTPSQMYEKGNKAYHRRDYKSAVRCFRDAAQRGHVEAQRSLATMYDIGLGVAKNENEALRWYRKVAEQGDITEQYRLGLKYEDAKDYAEAMKWYRMAAEQGDMAAQDKLGNMHYRGYGVEKNYTEAMKWYRKAAKQGYNLSEFMLGNMYEKGEGVPIDLPEAKRWYKEAADHGFPGAREALERLERL